MGSEDDAFEDDAGAAGCVSLALFLPLDDEVAGGGVGRA
jgi:hypothetical protein